MEAEEEGEMLHHCCCRCCCCTTLPPTAHELQVHTLSLIPHNNCQQYRLYRRNEQKQFLGSTLGKKTDAIRKPEEPQKSTSADEIQSSHNG